MQLHFKLRKTFTTSLSAAEATNTIQELLNSRAKFLFFSYATWFGSINGNEFTLDTQKGDSFGLFSARIKGSIHPEDPTIVNTRIVLPYFIICFFLSCMGMVLPSILLADQATINGVLKTLELSDRIGISLIVILAVAFALYMSIIWPLRKVEARFIKALKLEEKH